MMVDLKPCPFCGGTANLIKEEWGIYSFYYVSCGACLASTQHMIPSEDSAVNAWNRRQNDS